MASKKKIVLENRDEDNGNRWIKYAILGIVAAAVVFSIFYFDILSYLKPEILQAKIGSFGIWAPIAYAVFYFMAILVLLPASVFSVISGLLFGKFWGTVIVVVAATLSAAVAFSIARLFGEDLARKMAGSDKLNKYMKKIGDRADKHGFQTFFIMRCLFVPYIIFSYASGLVPKARIKDFLLATFITNIIFSFMFVYLGDSLLKGLRALIFPVVLVIIALQTPRVIKHFQKKRNKSKKKK